VAFIKKHKQYHHRIFRICPVWILDPGITFPFDFSLAIAKESACSFLLPGRLLLVFMIKFNIAKDNKIVIY